MDKKLLHPTEEQFQEWEQKYPGKLIILEPTADDDEVEDEESGKVPIPIFVFRKPERAHVARMTKTSLTDAYKAVRQLVADCRLFPDEVTTEAVFARKPGLVIPIMSKLQAEVGSNQDFTVKRR